MQQWPPLQRTVVPDEEEAETSGINVEAAKERLRKEDQEFDKIEYRRKIQEKHRVRSTVPWYFLSSWFMPRLYSSTLNQKASLNHFIYSVQLQVFRLKYYWRSWGQWAIENTLWPCGWCTRRFRQIEITEMPVQAAWLEAPGISAEIGHLTYYCIRQAFKGLLSGKITPIASFQQRVFSRWESSIVKCIPSLCLM